jgi:uncharacterized protein (DUF4415 family)
MRPSKIEPEILDADEIPELTEETARQLRPLGELLAERDLKLPGRPKSAQRKVAVSMRLDQAVVDGFKAGGPGWQTRINAVLAESLARAGKRR